MRGCYVLCRLRSLMKVKKKYSAVLLAAGSSRRMGKSKPFLLFNKNETFIEKCIQTFREFGCEEVIIVTSRQDYDVFKKTNSNWLRGVSLVVNDHPERGRFFSLQLGLMALSKAASCFFHNTDNPFVTIEVLKAMASCGGNAKAIYPVFKGRRGHPVLISKDIVRAIRSEKNHEYHLREFLNRFSGYETEVFDPGILVNINTPEDYEHYITGRYD